MEFKNLSTIAEHILAKLYKLKQNKPNILMAIDGRCGSGKTTLATYLQTRIPSNVISIDHFFKPVPDLENIDYERFELTVLKPLLAHKSFSYRPYNCRTKKMADPIYIAPASVNIIEGSYSLHPKFADIYDLTVFLTCDKLEQIRRITARNGKNGAKSFQEKWIPMEEKFFSDYNVEKKVDLYFTT